MTMVRQEAGEKKIVQHAGEILAGPSSMGLGGAGQGYPSIHVNSKQWKDIKQGRIVERKGPEVAGS